MMLYNQSQTEENIIERWEQNLQGSQICFHNFEGLAPCFYSMQFVVFYLGKFTKSSLRKGTILQ